MRIRAAFSTTRAPILSRLWRRVANSAQWSGILRGTASQSAHIIASHDQSPNMARIVPMVMNIRSGRS